MTSKTFTSRLLNLVRGVIQRHKTKSGARSAPAKKDSTQSPPVQGPPSDPSSRATLAWPDEFFDKRHGEWWQRCRHDGRKWWNPAWNGYWDERQNAFIPSAHHLDLSGQEVTDLQLHTWTRATTSESWWQRPHRHGHGAVVWKSSVELRQDEVHQDNEAFTVEHQPDPVLVDSRFLHVDDGGVTWRRGKVTWWAPDPDLPGKFMYNSLLAPETQENLGSVNDSMPDCRLERTDQGGTVWKRYHVSHKHWWAPHPCEPHKFIWDPPWPTEQDETNKMELGVDEFQQGMSAVGHEMREVKQEMGRLA